MGCFVFQVPRLGLGTRTRNTEPQTPNILMRDPFQEIGAIDRIDRRIAGVDGGGTASPCSASRSASSSSGSAASSSSPALARAEALVKATVYFFPADVFFPILGVWEVLIGIGLLVRPLIRFALFLLFLQMPGTMLPLVILPEECFTLFPFGLTLEGQYIIKNLVLISAALVVGGTVRHPQRRPNPSEAERVG